MNKELLKLAIPNILTNLTVPLVSLVDIGLMGHMPSTFYILAIGFGTVIFNFIYWAFGFLRMGTTGMVSQAFGRGDVAEQLSLLKRGLLVAIVGGLFLIILQTPLKTIAINIISPEAEVVLPLVSYFKVRIWAAPATISLYVLSGWLLGMQDSKSALWIALLVNGLNALISFYLVAYLDMDIEGVALGTVIAQYSGLVLAGLILKFKHSISLRNLIQRQEGNLTSWKEFMMVNKDIFIRTLCLIFVMSFFKTKAGNIDPLIGAANILLLEFITISAYGIDGFAFAAESISGKYFGKKDSLNFKRSVSLSMLWGLGMAFILSIVFWMFGAEILSILTNKFEVIQKALEYLPWLILAPIVNAFAFIWDGIFVGTTASKAMRNSMIASTLFVFLPLFFIAKSYLANHGMWLAFTLFMLSRGVFQTILAPKHIFKRLEPSS